jgi:serine/threonine protein kinase
VFREVEVLKRLRDVQGIVSLIDFFVRPKEFHIVQVFAKGGDVFDRLAERTTYTEQDTRELAIRLLNTIKDMHERGFVHRDLKPENLLLKSENDDYNILLADFGFSKKIPRGGLHTRCGTPAFVAPEIVVGAAYDERVDMWSFGVLMFLLIGGYPPFQGEDHRRLFRKVRAADYIFHETYWENVSIEVKQLIASLLVVNPDYRWTAKEALEESCWLKMEEETLSERDLSRTIREIRKFNARRKLKSAIMAVHWATKARFWNTDNIAFSQQTKGWDASAEEKYKKMSRPVNLGFRDVYALKKKLRKGSFATVWECMHKQTGELYAVKIINREGMKPSDDEAVMNEVAIMQSLSHKNIVPLVDFYEEKSHFYLVMDYMSGGDVFDRIVELNHYTEKDARDLAMVLLKAVKYMHEQGVAHRDIKPQNLLIKEGDDTDIKVADFGFARRVHTPQSLTTRCGTPTYVAPEILKNIPHDTKVDMWSVGVVIYVLLVGYPPFMEDKQQELFRKIRSGDYEFFEEDWGGISQEAKDLVKGLLVVDPNQRLSASAALRSPWFEDAISGRLSSRSLNSSLLGLKEKRNRLRSIAAAVIWLSRAASAEPVQKSHLVSVVEEDSDGDVPMASTGAL